MAGLGFPETGMLSGLWVAVLTGLDEKLLAARVSPGSQDGRSEW